MIPRNRCKRGLGFPGRVWAWPFKGRKRKPIGTKAPLGVRVRVTQLNNRLGV